jgi:hypothetical protein
MGVVEAPWEESCLAGRLSNACRQRQDLRTIRLDHPERSGAIA